METRRFDELTVAIARGGSRRGVLRGLAGGLLGALALDRSGALAKNDNENNGRGKPETIEAAPVCDPNDPSPDCPLCAAAKQQDSCCDLILLGQGKEQACGGAVGRDCTQANQDFCDDVNAGNRAGEGSCVQATCKSVSGGVNGTPDYRCEYRKKEKFCSGTKTCCSTYRSGRFGQCLSSRSAC